MNENSTETLDFVKRVSIATGIVILFVSLTLFVWYSASVWLAVFAGVLLGVLLDGLTHLLMRYTPFSRIPALITVILVLAFLFGAFGWFAAPQIGNQVSQFQKRVPQAIEKIQKEIEQVGWVNKLKERFPKASESSSSVGDMVKSIFTSLAMVVGGLTNVLVVVVIGIYLAVDPHLYIRGVVRLFPQYKRGKVRNIFSQLGNVLNWWLIGQFSAMFIISVLSIIGLTIAGIPLAFTLGIIAGLLAFIPFLGPIVSMIPAMLVAVSDDPIKALYVVIVFVVIQFLEGNFITPLIQLRAVTLPPVVLIAAQVLMGVLFGVFSILMAAPLAVVVMVLIQIIYVQDTLNDPIEIMGEKNGSH